MAADSDSMRKVGSVNVSLNLRRSRQPGRLRLAASTNSHPKDSARSLATVFLNDSAAPVMMKTMLLTSLFSGGDEQTYSSIVQEIRPLPVAMTTTQE